MGYLLSVGYLKPTKGTKDKISKVLKNGNGDRGIGLHRLFPQLKFENLDHDISNDERCDIFDHYYNICDDYYRDSSFTERDWVSNPKLNRYRGSNIRHIDNKFMEDFKNNVKGGRDFFRAIKDEYVDNETKPNLEVCMVNTPSFKNSLKIIAKTALSDDLTIEQIDFIKWIYWWSTNCLSSRGDLTTIKFSKG